MNEQTKKLMDRAFEIVIRYSESTVLEMAIKPASSQELFLAAEVWASMQRRILRDSGITKEMLNAGREAASKMAESLYEDSGVGRDVRAFHASKLRTEAVPTKEQWDSAGEAAQAAIFKVMNNNKEQGNDEPRN